MDPNTKDNESAASSGVFPPTLWTVVAQAIQGVTPEAQQALGKLCAIYRGPVVNWLMRRGRDRSSAEDASQSFMLYLLEKNRLQHFVRGKAKFRSFLLECLKRFLRDEWQKGRAAKRGGGEAPVSLDELEVGVADDLDRQLDRDFALAVHHRVLQQLEEKHTRSNQAQRFQTLRQFVLGTDSSGVYAEVAQALEMSIGAVRKAVFDLREAYCDGFRAEVAHLVARESIDEEMRYLITLLADTEATA